VWNGGVGGLLKVKIWIPGSVLDSIFLADRIARVG